MNLYSVKIKQEDNNESFSKTIYIVCLNINHIEDLVYHKVSSDWKILNINLMDSDVTIGIRE